MSSVASAANKSLSKDCVKNWQFWQCLWNNGRRTKWLSNMACTTTPFPGFSEISGKLFITNANRKEKDCRETSKLTRHISVGEERGSEVGVLLANQ
jgi:hypothetical protein